MMLAGWDQRRSDQAVNPGSPVDINTSFLARQHQFEDLNQEINNRRVTLVVLPTKWLNSLIFRQSLPLSHNIRNSNTLQQANPYHQHLTSPIMLRPQCRRTATLRLLRKMLEWNLYRQILV
jgi:hypothetical protein